MPEITTRYGLSFIPGVSSSKKRNSPALAAGIGASVLRLFSLLLISNRHVIDTGCVGIKDDGPREILGESFFSLVGNNCYLILTYS